MLSRLTRYLRSVAICYWLMFKRFLIIAPFATVALAIAWFVINGAGDAQNCIQTSYCP